MRRSTSVCAPGRSSLSWLEMVLSFPRDIVAEMYLNGWTNVVSYVRQTDPVVIKRGAAGEQAKVAPGQLTCVLENGTGDMDPQNPLGKFFGLLSRNTPFRWAVRPVKATFGQTMVNGWSNTDTGDA